MYEKTYRGISRLAKEYFVMLCGTYNLHGTYDCLSEAERPGRGETFTISLSGRETWRMMQRVFEAVNG